MEAEKLRALAGQRKFIGNLAALPVCDLAVGRKPYVLLHALDRDMIVDLLSKSEEARSSGLKAAIAAVRAWADGMMPETRGNLRAVADDLETNHDQILARFETRAAHGQRATQANVSMGT